MKAISNVNEVILCWPSSNAKLHFLNKYSIIINYRNNVSRKYFPTHLWFFVGGNWLNLETILLIVKRGGSRSGSPTFHVISLYWGIKIRRPWTNSPSVTSEPVGMLFCNAWGIKNDGERYSPIDTRNAICKWGAEALEISLSHRSVINRWNGFMPHYLDGCV